MSSRLTQSAKATITNTTTLGGNSRATQSGKAQMTDLGSLRLGGSARNTQTMKIMIGTRPIVGGGLMLRGIGS